MRQIAGVAALTVFYAVFGAIFARGQAGADAAGGDGQDTGAGGSRVLLVLPFDNRTGQPSMEWMREAASQILSMRFASAGFQPTSRADRVYALDHLGLPQGFQPSRASAIKLAQTLDADSIVVGSYTTDGSGIVAEATLVDVTGLRMLPEVSARGEMKDLIAVFGELAWKLTKQLDPGFNVAEETFMAAGNGDPLGRVRAVHSRHHGAGPGGAAATSAECGETEPRIRCGMDGAGPRGLQRAAISGGGRAFAKVDRNWARRRSRPDFYRGLSLMFSGDYPHAERRLRTWPSFCRWPRS